MLPFNFKDNRSSIENVINARIKIAGLKDPAGFTLIEGIVIPVTTQLLQEYTSLNGKLLPQVAIVGKSTGLMYFFYLDSLFPGQGLD